MSEKAVNEGQSKSGMMGRILQSSKNENECLIRTAERDPGMQGKDRIRLYENKRNEKKTQGNRNRIVFFKCMHVTVTSSLEEIVKKKKEDHNLFQGRKNK